MKFHYSAFLSAAPDSGDEVIIFRPEVPLRVHGPGGSAVYMALVDTGADNTILPLSIAKELKIDTDRAKGPRATAFGGQPIALLYADLPLEISEGGVTLRWHARVHFFDFPKAELETLVVGHQGFLDFFTALFEGGTMTLTLERNDDMPIVDASAAN
jgi:hypothetical protein